jgi:hypothetical protein
MKTTATVRLSIQGKSRLRPGYLVFGLSSLVLHAAAAAPSQVPPEFVWARQARQAGQTVENSGRGIALDGQGNVYVSGYFGGTATFGQTNLTSKRYVDMFVAKYDSAGNVLWVWQAGGEGDYRGYDIAVDAVGNSYVAGTFCCRSVAFGNTNLTAAPGVGGEPGDTFIAKYDTDGNLLWVRNHQSINIGLGDLSVAVDGAGNAFLTGEFKSTVSFGSQAVTSRGGWDTFVVKYGSQGNVIWARSGGGTSDDFGLDVAADAIGNVYVTGTVGATATFGSTNLINPSGNALNFVAQYDSAGNLLWVLGEAGGSTIAVDESGHFYTAGTDLMGRTMVLDEYDSAANLLWRHQAQVRPSLVSSSPLVNGLRLAPNGASGLFLVGTFRGAADFGATNLVSSDASYLDLFVSRYDGTGQVLGIKQVAMNHYLSYPTIAVDAVGNAYVTGSFYGRTSFGSTILTGDVPTIFLARMGIPPSLEEQPENRTTVSGDHVSFSVRVADSATLPLGYDWRWQSNFSATQSLQNAHVIIDGRTATLVLSNVQLFNSGFYSVIVTNVVGAAISAAARLTLDDDADELPDDWEVVYGLSPTNAADATLDWDGDLMTNLEEYLAGTNPTNALSVLKFDSIRIVGSIDGLVRLSFEAVSNKSYIVQSRAELGDGSWFDLVNITAEPSNRVVTVTNPVSARRGSSYYRLVKP